MGTSGTMMLRNSERQSFKKCRWRWKQSYVEGLQSETAPTALRFGDLVHRALAPYYKPGRKRGPHPAKTFERLYHAELKAKREAGFDVYSDENWVNALDLGLGMLTGYVEQYAGDDLEWEVIAPEQTFKLPLTAVGMDGVKFKFFIVGTFDGVWRHIGSKRLVFKEFKTAGSIQLDGLPMDEQAGTYWTYGPKWLRRKGLLKEGEELSHILYTFLRKAIPDPDGHYNEDGHKLNKPSKEQLREEYARTGRRLPPGSGGKGAVLVEDMIADLGERAWQLGDVSKSQPAPYFHREPVYRDRADRENMHERVLAEAAEVRAARAGQLAIIKNPGPLHMPNCRGCFARDFCEVHEVGGDWVAVRDMSTRPWNAYAAHELVERH